MFNQKEKLKHWKHQNINLNDFLQKVESDLPLVKSEDQDNELDDSISWKMLETAQEALQNEGKVRAFFEVKNTDRAIGTILSHEITKKYKSEGMKEDSLVFDFKGTAGQSYGAFCNKGLTMILEGDANDYFGKGLSGAKLAVKLPEESKIKAHENSIIGNVALYGATSGKAFINGMAGERFCVRNSGATAVVEGVGDHGCEYMTGGTVVILGDVGRNFGAGMSGGIAYVWDVNKSLDKNFNPDMADLEPLEESDIQLIKQLIEEHVTITGSEIGQYLLSDFEQAQGYFVKVYPRDYKKLY